MKLDDPKLVVDVKAARESWDIIISALADLSLECALTERWDQGVDAYQLEKRIDKRMTAFADEPLMIPLTRRVVAFVADALWVAAFNDDEDGDQDSAEGCRRIAAVLDRTLYGTTNPLPTTEGESSD